MIIYDVHILSGCVIIYHVHTWYIHACAHTTSYIIWMCARACVYTFACLCAIQEIRPALMKKSMFMFFMCIAWYSEDISYDISYEYKISYVWCNTHGKHKHGHIIRVQDIKCLGVCACACTHVCDTCCTVYHIASYSEDITYEYKISYVFVCVRVHMFVIYSAFVCVIYSAWCVCVCVYTCLWYTVQQSRKVFLGQKPM